MVHGSTGAFRLTKAGAVSLYARSPQSFGCVRVELDVSLNWLNYCTTCPDPIVTDIGASASGSNYVTLQGWTIVIVKLRVAGAADP